MSGLILRRKAMMAANASPALMYVTDGLVVFFNGDNADLENMTWADEKQVASSITATGYDNNDGIQRIRTTGGNSVIFTPQQFNTLFTGDWSIEVSHYLGGNNTVFALGSTSTNGAGTIEINAFHFKSASSTPSEIILTRNYDRRHHVVTYDSTDETYRLYQKGVYQGACVGKTAISASEKGLRFGGWGGGFYTIRLYDRVLTADEVAQNYEYEAQYITFTD